MGLEVQLLAGPLAGPLGGPVRVTRNRVLVYLAAYHPERVSRMQVAQALWPDEPYGESGNRLRVGLTRLRSEGVLFEDGERIGLVSGIVHVDLAEIRDQIALAGQEPDPGLERVALESLAPRLVAPLMPLSEEAWQEEVRTRWALEAGEALARLAQIEEERGDAEACLRAAEFGLRLLPLDEGFWGSRIRSAGELGKADEVVREFGQTRRTLRSEGTDFSADLIQLAEDTLRARSRPTAEPQLTAGERDALARMMARAVAHEPELAVAILGCTSFRPEVVRAPQHALRLLREALERSPEPSEARERCQVRVITALALLENDEQLQAEAEDFLSGNVHPARRRIALLNVSFSYFQTGHYERAYRAIDEAIQIADQTGEIVDGWLSRCQRASFWLLSNRPAEAEAVYREALAALADSAPLGDRVTTQGNLGLALYAQRRFAEAAEVLREVDQTARAENLDLSEGLNAPLRAAAEAHLGHADIAKRVLLRSLRVSYRTGRKRVAIAAVGAAADALVALGAPGSEKVRAIWASLHADSGLPVPPLFQLRLERALAGGPLPSVNLLEGLRETLEMVRGLRTETAV